MVTGGAGFIGCNLVRFLIESTPHSILNIDKLTYAGNPSSLRDVESSDRYDFRKLDIADPDPLRGIFASFKPDCILNLAAESHVDRSIDSPWPFIHTNVNGTFWLLETARHYFEQLAADEKKRFRFLHVSTDEIYGSLSLTEPGATEEAPTLPSSPYSATKAAADHLVNAWARTFGLPVMITRSSNNFGPFQHPEKLIPTVIISAIRHRPIPVYGTGENIRDWIYVTDHVRALYDVLMRGQIGQTYNIGGDNQVKNIDLVRCISRKLNSRLRAGQVDLPNVSTDFDFENLISFVRDRPGHDFRYALDSTRLATEIGWRAEVSMEAGLEKSIDWYLANRSWWENLISNGDSLSNDCDSS